jgi:hypothetical protein
MPIASGQRGGPGIMGMRSIVKPRFLSPQLGQGAVNLRLSGITYNNTGLAPVGGVTVDLFRVEDNAWVARTVSDGSGNYSFPITVGGPFFTRVYKTGVPDIAGTSANNLTPVIV